MLRNNPLTLKALFFLPLSEIKDVKSAVGIPLNFVVLSLERIRMHTTDKIFGDIL